MEEKVKELEKRIERLEEKDDKRIINAVIKAMQTGYQPLIKAWGRDVSPRNVD